MDASAEQAWSRSVDDMDPLTLNASMDDLGNLFEFGDIDLNNLPNIDTSASYDEHMQHTSTHPSTPFNELNEPHTILSGNAHDFAGQQRFGPSASADQAQRHPQSSQFTSDVAFQQSMQQHDFHPSQSFQFQAMPGYPMHQQIPPTPNSYEMHGEQGRFLQSQLDPQQRALLEQKHHLRKEDAIAFTPMVSPAGTPQYNTQPEFTIPGAYFSPLTSPMLHAQASQQAQSQPLQHGYYTNPSTAPSSNATSPLNASVDVDMLADEAESTEAPTRKSTRRKVPTPRSAGPLARVKQSPIQKAIKRKSGTILSSLPPSREADVNLDLQRSKSTQPTSAGLSIPRSDSSTTGGSISPEPLSEALMGPPPRPSSSRTSSPAIRAQQSNGVANSVGPAATPKSLLSMGRGAATRSEPRSHRIAGDVELDDLQLPAAADQSVDERPQTQVTTVSNDDTPRLSARKTPKLGPTSTPSSARLASAAPSPAMVGSPMTASTPGALLKERKESKSSRGGKKRGSISGGGSNMVSPALRPRISPSIKPLLPEGAALHSPTHALLLASKSNYQNLLEGNQLPGVNYPESLSTGLTSKRTSHKVAEQGRRNRINEALKEMQSLLPKGKENSTRDGSPEINAEDSKESKEDALAKSNSSKAATVESANEYIRKLQKENAALLILKKENEEMRKRLEAAQSRSGSGSENSDDKSPDESVEATS